MMKTAHARALRVADMVFMIVLLHILSLLLAWGDVRGDVPLSLMAGPTGAKDAEGVRPV
jgi:hypothetical protein